MAQGTRTRTQKSSSVQLDYLIHIKEIKPWPPTQSLRTLRAVLIQWEHGDRSSGMTNQVVPSLGASSGVGDGRIEFNESFSLPVTLMRDVSIKRKAGHIFHKNCIEFNLYEPRREKAVKGQLLGSAVLDLAAHSFVKESLCVSVPINCKRTYWNTAQPLLHLKIQSVERGRSNSSVRERLVREDSLDLQSNYDSVSILSEEYAEEAERTSMTTDDDISSHSSLGVGVTSAAAESSGSSSPQTKKEGTAATNGAAGETKTIKESVTESSVKLEGTASDPSSMNLSSDLSWISIKICSQTVLPSAPTMTSHEKEPHHNQVQLDGEEQQSSHNDHEKEPQHNQKNVTNDGIGIKIDSNPEEGIQSISIQSPECLDSQTDEHPVHGQWQDVVISEEPSTEKLHLPPDGFMDERTTEKLEIYAEESSGTKEEEEHVKDQPLSGHSVVDIQKQATLENGPFTNSEDNFMASVSTPNISTPKHGKSVRSLGDSSQSDASVRSNRCFVAQGSISNECKDAMVALKDSRNVLSDSRIQELEHRIKILEGELREAAAIEVSLYSVIAEHGSSMTKIHAPARRLVRSYFHANKQSSRSRASAAKSIVSGLVLVSKACGNDVPRLTFWLSNSIVLRVIMSISFKDSKLPTADGPPIGTEGNRTGNNKSSLLRWETFAKKSTRNSIEEWFGDWGNPLTFVAALEKVEAWIFSRIIESIWWQTFTPHMQSGNAEEIRSSMDAESKTFRRTSSSIDQQQGNFSMELWKMAFRDACELICPVRAGGHDCSCLPVLSRVIMEQLITRLDVAMFNAILRESADEIPTDPVADPISDAEVLPIPAGKASFGAGAQLKTAIGNWSRWLTDLFGIDDCDVLAEEDKCNLRNTDADDDDDDDDDDDEGITGDTASKSFHLLNALSDLLMLPKDLLLSRTVRKEVCPTFGPSIIARVLNSFAPDEFCPDPIPAVVLEALNSELEEDADEDGFNMNFPCGAAPIVYEPPPAAAVADILGDFGGYSDQALLRRSRSSVLKKSQTSDDELEELDYPLKSIILGSSTTGQALEKYNRRTSGNGGVRYQLLRDVWMKCD